MWVRREREAKAVSFNNKSFGGFSKVRYNVRDVTFWDVVLCGGVKDLAEQGRSPVLQEESSPKRAKYSSAFKGRLLSVHFFKVHESSMRRWKELSSKTMIERWSELRVVRVRLYESKVLWEVAIMMSGEMGSP